MLLSEKQALKRVLGWMGYGATADLLSLSIDRELKIDILTALFELGEGKGYHEAKAEEDFLNPNMGFIQRG